MNNAVRQPSPRTRNRPSSVPAPGATDINPGHYAVLNPSGRLSVFDPPSGQATPATLGRRTTTGTVYRIDLDDGITCWLNGDQRRWGEDNWVANDVCARLSLYPGTDPSDPALDARGTVLFTGTAAAGLTGLSDAQLHRLTIAHAAANYYRRR